MKNETKNELITNGSALIAEYIGWVKTEKGNYMIPNLFPMEGNAGETECERSDMNFHDRWDWLMRVVEIIETNGYDVRIEHLSGRDICSIQDRIGNDLVYVDYGRTKIESTFKAVVTLLSAT